MGSWGTAISSNDTFAEVYAGFFDFYNEGIEPGQITERIIHENQDLISDREESNNFWFALAKAQYDCGALDKKVLSKVKDVIESGADMGIWKELGASDSDLRKRKAVLEKFLKKISAKNKNPKKRKKKVLRNAIFAKGDCLTFRLENGNHGGALVLEAENNSEHGLNLLATTTINQPQKPTIKDFETADVLVRRVQILPGNYKDIEQVSWCYAQFYKKAKTKFETIGKLEIRKAYNARNDFQSFSHWDTIPLKVSNDSDYSKKFGTPRQKVTLKELRY